MNLGYVNYIAYTNTDSGWMNSWELSAIRLLQESTFVLALGAVLNVYTEYLRPVLCRETLYTVN